jgi:predicted nucleic acid-binding protein
VVEEVKVGRQKQQLENYSEQGKLLVLSLDSTEIRDAVQLLTEYSLKGITDRSVLLKAIQLQGIVLSGDGNLRKECQRRGLEVRGSIWVIREIWESGLADSNVLIPVLDQLQENTRLPKQALEDLKNEIKSS